MLSLGYTFLVFLLLLALFHIPIIRVIFFTPNGLPTDPKKWKKNCEKADYLWLILSTLALITAANEVTRMLSNVEVSTLLPYVGHSGVLEHAKTFRESAERTIHPLRNDSVKWFDDGIAAVTNGDNLLKEAKQMLREEKGENAVEKLEQAMSAYGTFLDKHKSISNEAPAAYDARLLRNAVEDRHRHTGEIINSYVRTRKRDGEKLLILFSPLILAVGLAVRFAKVSAKVLVDV